MNGDGLDDMLVGAIQCGGGAGTAYLVLGTSSPDSLSLADADAAFEGESVSDNASWSVSAAGDVDGDGYDDVLVGAPPFCHSGGTGSAYLVLGSSTPASASLADADARYTAASSGDWAGWSVASIGDIDTDGYDDILIGSNLPSTAYLVLGSSSPSSLSLADADASYTGGHSVAGAGDVDGNGSYDMLLSSGTASLFLTGCP